MINFFLFFYFICSCLMVLVCVGLAPGIFEKYVKKDTTRLQLIWFFIQFVAALITVFWLWPLCIIWGLLLEAKRNSETEDLI